MYAMHQGVDEPSRLVRSLELHERKAHPQTISLRREATQTKSARSA